MSIYMNLKLTPHSNQKFVVRSFGHASAATGCPGAKAKRAEKWRFFHAARGEKEKKKREEKERKEKENKAEKKKKKKKKRR
jgi:hypothetical protein